jgi:uncharacterized protein UPF0175
MAPRMEPEWQALIASRVFSGSYADKWYLERMQVTVEIPDEFADVLAPAGEDTARKLLEDRTAQAYREGKLTMDEVRRALGFSTRLEVDPFLLKYQIYDYTIDDFRDDVRNLRQLRRQQNA